jgi:hypothetical protein
MVWFWMSFEGFVGGFGEAWGSVSAGCWSVFSRFWLVVGRFWLGVEDICPEGRLQHAPRSHRHDSRRGSLPPSRGEGCRQAQPGFTATGHNNNDVVAVMLGN